MNEVEKEVDLRIRPGAKALIVKDGKVLLIKERLRGRVLHDFPGGGLEFGESVEEALVREVQEEIGVAVVPEKIVGTWNFLIRDDSIHVLCIGFQCRLEGNEKFDFSQNPAEEDIFDVEWITPRELIEKKHEYFPDCLKMIQSVEALEL